MIIEGSIIKSVGNLISTGSYNCNLTVRNCYGEGLEPLVSGIPHGRFIDLYKPSRVIVENNHLDNTAGIYLLENGTNLSEIKVRYNQNNDN